MNSSSLGVSFIGLASALAAGYVFLKKKK
ncbi:MAG: LPXTG cell wall anchor domain-containing protein [Ruminococcaceae bacterium]|nr:LPXTG cell wall anchor domain-containing protein [Oscillospiraceae bacterium]